MEQLVLFQGDSITDCSREGANPNNLGHGYPTMVAAELGYKYPEENYFFCNRGVSGNRIVDLYARIKRDIVNIEPKYISILIGVNDVFHEIDGQNGVSCERFEMMYDLLISDILSQLPNVKIMLLEPFILEGPVTRDKAGFSNRYITFRKEVELRAAATKRIAEKYNLVFVPLQKDFDDAKKRASSTYWISDGIHPTPMGHKIIKDRWIEAFEKLKNS